MNRGNWNGAAYSPLAEQLSPASTEALRSIGHVSTAYDVCAGTGNFTLPAAQSGIAVHALDLSASQLEVARERWIPRPGTTEPTFTIGDAQSLPWSDSSADACVSIFGIIFCPNPAIALAEMMRVTRPGGRSASQRGRRTGGQQHSAGRPPRRGMASHHYRRHGRARANSRRQQPDWSR
ncbi:class I SAM-dependent methyltransferase [Rhodococcus sp. 1.20]